MSQTQRGLKDQIPHNQYHQNVFAVMVRYVVIFSFICLFLISVSLILLWFWVIRLWFLDVLLYFEDIWGQNTWSSSLSLLFKILSINHCIINIYWGYCSNSHEISNNREQADKYYLLLSSISKISCDALPVSYKQIIYIFILVVLPIIYNRIQIITDYFRKLRWVFGCYGSMRNWGNILPAG